MGLKDEIEKIIATELEKLREDDRREEEFWSEQRQRFQPMRALLQEFVASVGPDHLKAKILDEIAILQMGKFERESECFETDVTWRIEPNSESEFANDSLQWRAVAGFCITETGYNRLPSHVTRRLKDFGYGETMERRHTFDTATEAAQYLVEQIAKKLAWYKHLDQISDSD